MTLNKNKNLQVVLSVALEDIIATEFCNMFVFVLRVGRFWAYELTGPDRRVRL